MRKLVIVGFLSALALVFTAGASAAPGDLDATFGTSGVARTDVGTFDSATDLAIQPDGEVVAAGTVDWNGTRNVFLARYTEDGVLDPEFASGGIVVPDRYHQVGPQVALQGDGKIVLATRGESSGGPVFLYRFNTDGLPDAAFGGDGTAVMSAPAGVSVLNVAGVHIVAGGKIMVVLRTSLLSGREVVSFARFDADGTRDGSFGSGGFAQVDIGYSWLPFASALRSDGRILVSGFASVPGRFFSDAFVARFTPDGILDTSFDTDGVAIVQQSSNATEFQALTVAPDGSVFAGGREWGSTYGQNRWLLARFTAQGTLDAGFGSSGLTFYDPGTGDDVILDLAATSAGIYATGLTENVLLGLPVALFTSAGALDSRFGAGGIAGITGTFTRGSWRLATQDDGKVVAVGSIQSFTPSFNQDIVLARYGGVPLDVDAPNLILPSVVNGDAISPRGAPIDYSARVSATDNVDPNPTVSCIPEPGSTFPIGDTTVSCAATDAAGNSSSGSFTVHVKGATEQVADLIALVDSYNLGKLGASLHDKLMTVQRFLGASKQQQAKENLTAFISQVDGQRGKGLTQSQADALKSAAQRIINVIGP